MVVVVVVVVVLVGVGILLVVVVVIMVIIIGSRIVVVSGFIASDVGRVGHHPHHCGCDCRRCTCRGGGRHHGDRCRGGFLSW